MFEFCIISGILGFIIFSITILVMDYSLSKERWIFIFWVSFFSSIVSVVFLCITDFSFNSKSLLINVLKIVFSPVVFIPVSLITKHLIEEINWKRLYKYQANERCKEIKNWEDNHPGLIFCNECDGTGFVTYQKVVREWESHDQGRLLFVDSYLGAVYENDGSNKLTTFYEYATATKRCESCLGKGGTHKVER